MSICRPLYPPEATNARTCTWALRYDPSMFHAWWWRFVAKDIRAAGDVRHVDRFEDRPSEQRVRLSGLHRRLPDVVFVCVLELAQRSDRGAVGHEYAAAPVERVKRVHQANEAIYAAVCIADNGSAA
jgi:hypothetical protein